MEKILDGALGLLEVLFISGLIGYGEALESDNRRLRKRCLIHFFPFN